MKTYAYIAFALTLFLAVAPFSSAWAVGAGDNWPCKKTTDCLSGEWCSSQGVCVPRFSGDPKVSAPSPGAPPLPFSMKDRDAQIAELIMHRANMPFTQEQLGLLGASSPQEAEKNLAERKRQIILFLRTLENAVNAGVVPTEAQLEGILGRPSSDAAGQRKPGGKGLRNALLAVLTAVWMKWDDITGGQ